MEPGAAPERKPGLCEEKDRLLREYNFATADFSRAVQVLHSRIGVLTKEEYERVQRFSEESRLRSEKARLELERHTADHGC